MRSLVILWKAGESLYLHREHCRQSRRSPYEPHGKDSNMEFWSKAPLIGGVLSPFYCSRWQRVEIHARTRRDDSYDCRRRQWIVLLFPIDNHVLASRHFLAWALTHVRLPLNSPPSKSLQPSNKRPHRLQINDLIRITSMSMEDTFRARFGQRQKVQISSGAVRPRVLEQITKNGNDC